MIARVQWNAKTLRFGNPQDCLGYSEIVNVAVTGGNY